MKLRPRSRSSTMVCSTATVFSRGSASTREMSFDLPHTREELSEIVCETCRQNNLRDAYIRLVVTRGVGDLGLAPWLCKKPSMFVIASKITLYPQEHYDNGLAIVTVPTRRINPAALPPTVKSLNYLNNILGKIEAKQFGALEAIMLNDQGYVAECTADNIFIVLKAEILTPGSSQGALKGITRGSIFDIASELGLPIREVDMTLDGREIGTGKPGPITQQVLASFRRRVTIEGTKL